MTKEHKEATDIIHNYRMLLMDEGDDYGEEILVSVLSKKMALIYVNGIIKELERRGYTPIFYREVKAIIESE